MKAHWSTSSDKIGAASARAHPEQPIYESGVPVPTAGAGRFPDDAFKQFERPLYAGVSRPSRRSATRCFASPRLGKVVRGKAVVMIADGGGRSSPRRPPISGRGPLREVGVLLGRRTRWRRPAASAILIVGRDSRWTGRSISADREPPTLWHRRDQFPRLPPPDSVNRLMALAARARSISCSARVARPRGREGGSPRTSQAQRRSISRFVAFASRVDFYFAGVPRPRASLCPFSAEFFLAGCRLGRDQGARADPGSIPPAFESSVAGIFAVGDINWSKAGQGILSGSTGPSRPRRPTIRLSGQAPGVPVTKTCRRACSRSARPVSGGTPERYVELSVGISRVVRRRAGPLRRSVRMGHGVWGSLLSPGTTPRAHQTS